MESWSLKDDKTKDLVKYLKDHSYPVPSDCPGVLCNEVRTGCKLGICKIAVERMCEDY